MRLVPRPAATATAALSALAALALVLAGTPAQAADGRKDAWHLDALELTELHKVSQGEGITVAVVDTGVDARHPDLKNNVLPGVDLYDDRSKGHQDRQGHGTAMASLIAGHGHGAGGREGVLGVAPKAKILPVTVQGAEGKAIIAPDALAAGIDWAVDHGADVVNVSLGSSTDVDLDRAVKRAYQKNVIVVAAVGNKQDAIIGSPARHPGALAVTGTDRNGRPSQIAAIPAEETDLAAPGDDLFAALPNGQYTMSTGSSGSAALVSGAVALVKSKHPNLNSYDLFKRMLETTRDAGKPGKDLDYGYGQLDLRRALTGEPDGRGNRSQAAQEPEVDPTLARARAVEGPGAGETVLVTLIWVAFLLVVVTGVVLAVVLLRRRRRRRAGAPATEALIAVGAPAASPPPYPPAPGEPYPPVTGAHPGVPPSGPAGGPPAHPTDPTGDAGWRRPGA
ncbi:MULTISPECIES: type VII secretion-associated serine protease mycosin [unclassified Micromonospora]|uniref:type VII secretion-associated serine protease mycosin n=1 Tax=unclassified Micromonospora TaxID=2617518 RepID=UPI003332CC17